MVPFQDIFKGPSKFYRWFYATSSWSFSYGPHGPEIFIYLFTRDTMRERQRHRQRKKKQAPCRERNAELGLGTPGSHLKPKADAQPLSHPGIPIICVFNYQSKTNKTPPSRPALSSWKHLCPRSHLGPPAHLDCGWGLFSFLFPSSKADLAASPPGIPR